MCNFNIYFVDLGGQHSSSDSDRKEIKSVDKDDGAESEKEFNKFEGEVKEDEVHCYWYVRFFSNVSKVDKMDPMVQNVYYT